MVSIALIVLAYLLIFPAFVALRLREPSLKRTFRVPGGVRIAWLVTGLATGWSLLAAVCLLWPGLGTAIRTLRCRRASRRSVGNSNFSFLSRSEW